MRVVGSGNNDMSIIVVYMNFEHDIDNKEGKEKENKRVPDF